MKHLLAAFSLAVLSAPALAAGLPFEQVEIDRLVPVIPESRHLGVDYPFGGTPPYNQLDVDMAQPDVRVRAEPSLVASGGSTRSDLEISLARETMDASVWANDHNFIAPPQ
jgi:hypothetical protein